MDQWGAAISLPVHLYQRRVCRRHFFQNDTGEMWLSYDRDNQEEVSFIVGGEEWKPDTDAIIRLNDAFLCIREFLDTCGMPSCIQWQEL